MDSIPSGRGTRIQEKQTDLDEHREFLRSPFPFRARGQNRRWSRIYGRGGTGARVWAETRHSLDSLAFVDLLADRQWLQRGSSSIASGEAK